MGGLLHGRGCSHCNGAGYRGRMGLYEMLEMDRELVEVAAHESVSHFMQAARQHMRGKTILDHALEQLKQGRSTAWRATR